MNDLISPEDGATRAAVHPPRVWVLVILAVIMAIGLTIRVHGLDTKSFWIDEAASWRIARLPFAEFWSVLWAYEANMAFYYGVLAAWLHLGDSEIAMRSLSVLLAVATIPAVFIVGRRLCGPQPGLIAAGLLAVHALHIWYSQEARGYPLAILLVALATGFFVQLVRQPERRRHWIGYGACAVLAVYSHLFAVLVIAAHWMSLDRAQWRRLGAGRVAAAALGIGAALGPMGAFVVFKDQGQISWLPPTTGADLPLTLFALGGWNGALLVLLLAGLARTIASHWYARDDRWPLRLLSTGVFVPITTVFVASLLTKPLFFFRYFGVCLPAAMLLGGYMLSFSAGDSRRRKITASILLPLVLGLTAYSAAYFKKLTNEWGDDWRSAVEYLLARRQEGDALIFHVRAGRDSYDYYRDRLPSRERPEPLPRILIPADDELASANVVPGSDNVRRLIAGPRRIWLILHHAKPPVQQQLRADLESRYHLVEKKTFVGSNLELSIDLQLFALRAPGLPGAPPGADVPGSGARRPR